MTQLIFLEVRWNYVELKSHSFCLRLKIEGGRELNDLPDNSLIP